MPWLYYFENKGLDKTISEESCDKFKKMLGGNWKGLKKGKKEVSLSWGVAVVLGNNIILYFYPLLSLREKI